MGSLRKGVPEREAVMIPVAMRLGGTPVPIPNTMVKTQAADGTVLETVRESRRLPELKKDPGGRRLPEAL